MIDLNDIALTTMLSRSTGQAILKRRADDLDDLSG